jgi:hypothetical protein
MPMKNPPHPGDFIRSEIIEPAGLSVTAAAAALNVSRPALSSFEGRSFGGNGPPHRKGVRREDGHAHAHAGFLRHRPNPEAREADSRQARQSVCPRLTVPSTLDRASRNVEISERMAVKHPSLSSLMPILLTTFLASVRSIFRSRAALEFENLALRHQIAVVVRQDFSRGPKRGASVE